MAREKDGMNLNTLLLAIVIAVMAWVGLETTQSGKAIAVLQEQQAASKETITKAQTSLDSARDSLERLEAKLGETITRQEYAAKILSIEARLREIDVEITKLKKSTQ
jgi:hypothetical protein